MRVKLKLFYKWGIKFNENEPYTVADNGNREVEYANKGEIIDGIVQKYHSDWLLQEETSEKADSAGDKNQAESQNHEPQRKLKNKNKGGKTVLESIPLSRRKPQNKSHPQEVNSDEQT